MVECPSANVPSLNHAWLVKLATMSTPERQSASQEFIERVHNRGAGQSLDFSETDLAGLILDGVDLRRANLTRARLASTSLRSADLREVQLICPLLERVCFDGADMRGIYAHGLGMQIGSLVEANLSGASDVTGALFHGVRACRSRWIGANLAGTTFYQCDLRNANFESANLTGTVFNECTLDASTFRGAHLDDATILKSSGSGISLANASGEGLSLQRLNHMEELDASGAIFRELRLRNSSLRGASFVGADLSDSNLVAVHLEDADFTGSDLTRATWSRVSGTARFNRAMLAQSSFTHVVMRGAPFDGAQAENMRLVECDFAGASFASDENGSPFRARALTVRDSNLTGANFHGAYLYRAMFTGDPIGNMRLDRADFRGANLTQAYLAASLREAQLAHCRGAYARLNQADLTDANITGGELFQASLVKTNLLRANLSGVMPPIWLDRCGGLSEAIIDDVLASWIEQLKGLLKAERRGST